MKLLLDGEAKKNLLREVEAAEEVLKAGVGAEAVEARLDSHFDQTPIPFGIGLLQPKKGLAAIFKDCVIRGNVVRSESRTRGLFI